MRQASSFLPVLLALFVAAAAGRQESPSDRQRRLDFVQEMQRVQEETLRHKSQASLRERLLKVAQEMMPSSFVNTDRNLANNNNQNNDDDYLANYVYYSDASSSIDLAGYALKYVGCQNVHTWDDDLADGRASPLAMKRFVMFRMCKASDCSAYNKWGCNYNFGEYVIPMEDYLAIMAEYHFEQFGRFCKTCYRCMNLDYYQDDDYSAATNVTDDGGYNVTQDDGDYSYGGCSQNDVANGDCTDDAYWAGYRQYWGERRRLQYDDDAQGNGAKNYYYSNGNGGDDDTYQYNNAAQGNDDYYNNDVNNRPWYADVNGKCIFEETCSNYRSVCRKYDPESTHYEDYFTCSSFNMGGAYGYLGPHCRSDGRTIGIGMYKDQSCNEYIGDTVDLTDTTGMDFDDSELRNYYDKDCISCSAEESYSLVTDDTLANGQDLTYPLCSLAYQVAGKCDKYMSSSVTADQSNSYEYENQDANEESVCNFVESLVERNYNEKGEVVLRSSYFDPENWQSASEYAKVVREATTFQQFALGISMAIFFSLFAYAVYLTKKLAYRRPWRPPRSVTSPYGGGADADVRSISAVSEAGRISRASSGIVNIRTVASAGMTSVYKEDASMANSQLV